MKELIDKSALVAEIEKMFKSYSECDVCNSYELGLKEGRLRGYRDSLKKINNLKVKEVDFKKRFTWKPSVEQIIALRWILNNIPYNKHKEEISGLLDQIKDL